ncbi:MAG: ligand-binding SRPBCC domain-containing protein [Crocinitomicaceae bacterium]|jgi:ligand-binding SRPBCC domain-containing protein
MTQIKLTTRINAPIERVFDLSRSIDLHKISVRQTNEEAIAGKTSGLIGINETVTWRAKHLGVYQKLTVKITAFDRPKSFRDEMLKGAFKSMSHLHTFQEDGDATCMIDDFEFISPLGFIGRFVDFLFLKKYMTKFLLIRNTELKSIAEGEKWRDLLEK